MREPGTPEFAVHQLDEAHALYEGNLPVALLPSPEAFDQLWALHPAEYHDVRIHHRTVKTPRWQQAYNRDYVYTGSRNHAQPVPALIEPFWNWARETVDSRLNGILVNWYDGALGHYIGPHRDSRTRLVPESPIVTISLGEERRFRMRPWRGEGHQDFTAANGTVFVMPYATNLGWTHEVPRSRKYTGRRISVTIRAFVD